MAAIESLKDILSLSINAISLGSSKNGHIPVEGGGDNTVGSDVNVAVVGQHGDKPLQSEGAQRLTDDLPAELADHPMRAYSGASRGGHTLPEPVGVGDSIDRRA